MDFIFGGLECDDGSIFPLEGFYFANQCRDILDEFDAQDLDLDEVGGLRVELLRALFTMQVEVD